MRTGRLNGHRAFALDREAAQGMTRDQVQQRFWLERLDQVIRGALAHGIHRSLDGAVSGHQQDRQLRLTGAQQAE
nr:hypothetical protein GCM10020185_10010 [Pseudomonas brassicacearum subsp. brassicacearum]